MSDDIAWELQLQLADGALPAFNALMEDAAMPAADDDGVAAHYGWSVDEDNDIASIYLRYDDPPTVTVQWAGDWTTAERHLAAIGPGVARRLLMLARPVNLVEFDVNDEVDRDDEVATIQPAETSRARSRRRRTVSATTGSIAQPAAPGVASGYS